MYIMNSRDLRQTLDLLASSTYSLGLWTYLFDWKKLPKLTAYGNTSSRDCLTRFELPDNGIFE
jgi:hypothetical protein